MGILDYGVLGKGRLYVRDILQGNGSGGTPVNIVNLVHGPTHLQGNGGISPFHRGTCTGSVVIYLCMRQWRR